MTWRCFMQREPAWSHRTDLRKEIYALSWQPGSDGPQLWKCLSEQKKSHSGSCMNSATAEWCACDAQPYCDDKKGFARVCAGLPGITWPRCVRSEELLALFGLHSAVNLVATKFWRPGGLLLCGMAEHILNNNSSGIPGLLLEPFCGFSWDGTNLLSFMSK